MIAGEFFICYDESERLYLAFCMQKMLFQRYGINLLL